MNRIVIAVLPALPHLGTGHGEITHCKKSRQITRAVSCGCAETQGHASWRRSACAASGGGVDCEPTTKRASLGVGRAVDASGRVNDPCPKPSPARAGSISPSGREHQAKDEIRTGAIIAAQSNRSAGSPPYGRRSPWQAGATQRRCGCCCRPGRRRVHATSRDPPTMRARVHASARRQASVNWGRPDRSASASALMLTIRNGNAGVRISGVRRHTKFREQRRHHVCGVASAPSFRSRSRCCTRVMIAADSVPYLCKDDRHSYSKRTAARPPGIETRSPPAPGRMIEPGCARVGAAPTRGNVATANLATSRYELPLL